MKEVFDILEGTALADKIFDRIHYTKKAILRGSAIPDLIKYAGPLTFRQRTSN